MIDSIKIEKQNDLTENIRYQARAGGKIFMLETDGYWKPHLTEDEFKELVENELLIAQNKF